MKFNDIQKKSYLEYFDKVRDNEWKVKLTPLLICSVLFLIFLDSLRIVSKFIKFSVAQLSQI